MARISYKRLKRPWLGRLTCDVCSELATWIGVVGNRSNYVFTCDRHRALPVREIQRLNDKKHGRIS